MMPWGRQHQHQTWNMGERTLNAKRQILGNRHGAQPDSTASRAHPF
jgi:hypothetical protein